jgi:signal transduction histidine kinase
LAEIAGGFIHEIKNHLNTLTLNLQLLAEDFEDAQTSRERKARDRVTRLSEECRRLVDLANDFLRFARDAQVHPTPTDLAVIVTRLVDFLTPTARAQGITIDWFAADLPPVLLDADLFEKVLLNLMLNAEDAMPEGGRLTLQAFSTPQQVILDVIDTGCGMEPQVQEKIFRPFFTTKPEGTGLGLATARKIVQAHGGTLTVQSELGRGSKFRIALPVASTRTPAAAPIHDATDAELLT